ncbi:wax ester/triacylglycerol synthase family O-acyltransferase [Streptomyces sp. NPDC020965]|uniref:wax ester/triacylglycerol synthase family O-acyltransferase n=1 Tax=Streptomyces sp. NPDC020965 TaxID=3365105 RepID=UPI00379393A1
MSSELLAPLDLAFWHLDSTGHPMHLGALALFAPGDGIRGDGTRVGDPHAGDTRAEGTCAESATTDDILGLLATRAAAISRLRMRVRDVWLPVGGAAWTVDKGFDVHRHLHHICLPAGEFTTGATGIAGELMERPIERGRPPWEMYLLTGGADGSFAVLVKLHHALADGMRAVAIGAGIFDEIADPLGARARRAPARPADPRGVLGFARDRIDDLGRAVGVGASVVRASRLDARGLPALAAGPSGTRRLGTAVLDLAEVRRVRAVVGGTANDVLLAVVAGALRRWAAERGERLPATGPRALVPVSRHRPGSPPGPGNRLSAYLLELPVAEPDPRARLDAVRTAMERNKAAGPLRGAGAVAVLADQLPSLAHRFGAPLAGGAARLLFDVLVTSVPLPRAALSLGGRPLRAIYPMAPLARGQSLSIALTSHGGRVHIGLVADGKALPDLDRLAWSLGEELAELLTVTG